MLQFIRRKRAKPTNTTADDNSTIESPLSSHENTEAEDAAKPSNETSVPASESAAATSEDQLDTETTNTKSEATPDKTGFFGRLANKIAKTSNSLGSGIGEILLGKKEIDDELLEDIEMQLLTADIGVDSTRRIIDALTARIERDALTDPRALYSQLKQELSKSLKNQSDFVIDSNKAPFVILVVGVNGVGKTTTIGKLAKRLQNNNLSVMLAAGDTFRAAAVEQLQVWGERNEVPVVAQSTGSDSASVIFDGLQSAKSKNADVLIADTAGRLHNKDNLMEELKKVVRVIKKIDPSAPHEILLVLDATTGQNAVNQAEKFKEAVDVSGLAITKLDGTAKGGVVFAIAEKLSLPIRFIGVGEKIEDLRPFDENEFVEAIFEQVEGLH